MYLVHKTFHKIYNPNNNYRAAISTVDFTRHPSSTNFISSDVFIGKILK